MAINRVASPATFDFPPLDEVRENLRVKWYRCPIDPGRLRELMKRSDLQGAFQTLGHLGLFTATGLATAYLFTEKMWLPFALGLWFHGIVGVFFRGLAVHELGHGTVWRTKWVNGFFLRIFSLLTWWNHHEYAMSHTYHHRYTLHPDGDREVLLPRTTGFTLRNVLQLLTINIEGIVNVIGSALRMAIPRYNMNVTGVRTSEWTRELFTIAPEIKRKAIRWARITILFHLAIFAISAIYNVWWLSITLTGFLFAGNWLSYLVGQTMHLGLRDNVPDFRLCVRSHHLDPFTSFLYWRMNWHTEHHMYAGVPCYNLKKLAKEIASDMPELRSLWDCWREMLEIDKRQLKDPTYQYDTPLPPTAHPGVLTTGQIRSTEVGQNLPEESIGELAPKGQ